MAKALFGFTQDLPLVLEVLAFLFGLKTKCFSFGKITFENLFEFALWLLESPLPLSTIPSCHGISANPLS